MTDGYHAVMRPRLASPFLIVATATSLALSGCGDDDVFPRDEFVRQVMANGVKQPVAECAYDKIESNEVIMKELVRTDGPNSDISEKVSDELGPILARCLLAQEEPPPADTTTTTEKKSTTTTERSSDSKRSTTTSDDE